MTTAHALATLAAMRCRPGAPRLSDADVRAQLAVLPDWAPAGDGIAKTWRFADFHATMAFVNAVAAIAHGEDHHPELAVGYGRCTVTWSTHDAGGVTRNDCICAAKVECIPG